jgi:protein-disulfide isomerase
MGTWKAMINPVRSVEKSTRHVPCVVFSLLLGLGLSAVAPAQGQDRNKEMQEKISALQQNVRAIEEEQQRMSAQLDELKKMLQASSGPQPHPEAPATVALHGEPVEGDSAARVAIIEYADFECPYCGQYARDVYPQIVKNYISTGKIKYFYRDLPLSIHSHAMIAAQAARCARDQGKFWEMHDSLFANQAALTEKDMLNRAQSLGIDLTQLTQCLSSQKYSDEVRKSATEALSTMGIQGTPMFFLGMIQENGNVVKVGKVIMGAYPYEIFKADLDELLVSK